MLIDRFLLVQPRTAFVLWQIHFYYRRRRRLLPRFLENGLQLRQSLGYR